jgi:hypothetical protein
VKKILLLTAFGLLSLAGISYAQMSPQGGRLGGTSMDEQQAGGQQMGQQGGQRMGQGDKGRKPPQEAIDACSGKSEGDACQFIGRRGEEKTGQCIAILEKVIVCKPSDMQQGHENSEPDEQGPSDVDKARKPQGGVY